MKRAGLWVGLGGLCLLASPAYAVVGPCTNTTEVDATSLAVSQVTSELSARPARLCGVHLIATGANAFCQVFESPDTTDPAHGQSRTIAEPAAVTVGTSDHAWFGDHGYPTRFGVGVRAARGRCLVHWGP